MEPLLRLTVTFIQGHLFFLAVGSTSYVQRGVSESYAERVPLCFRQKEERVRDWGAHLELRRFHD